MLRTVGIVQVLFLGSIFNGLYKLLLILTIQLERRVRKILPTLLCSGLIKGVLGGLGVNVKILLNFRFFLIPVLFYYPRTLSSGLTLPSLQLPPRQTAGI